MSTAVLHSNSMKIAPHFFYSRFSVSCAIVLKRQQFLLLNYLFHFLNLKCKLATLNLVWMEKRWSRFNISIKDYLILIISAGDNSKMENIEQCKNIVINGLFSMQVAKQMNFVLNSVHSLKLTAHRELLQFPTLKNNGWLFLGWLTHQMSICTSFCSALFYSGKFSVKTQTDEWHLCHAKIVRTIPWKGDESKPARDSEF